MLDLAAVRARAIARVAEAELIATPANPANWLIEGDASVSQLAALASVAAQTDARGGHRARTCRPCQHRARHGNCTEPEAAGLWERFILVWAPEGHAATCPAYLERAPMRTP